MISYEEMGKMLDELAEELPHEFFTELNGGILLLPQAEMHPKSKNNDLYVMGRYYNSKDMGRRIEIYYGSFSTLYGNVSKRQAAARAAQNAAARISPSFGGTFGRARP